MAAEDPQEDETKCAHCGKDIPEGKAVTLKIAIRTAVRWHDAERTMYFDTQDCADTYEMAHV